MTQSSTRAGNARRWDPPRSHENAQPPPRPGSCLASVSRESPGRDSIHRVDERASVTGVTILQGDGALAVEIKHARDSHTGVLRWDQPPRFAGWPECCSRISADPSRASPTSTSPASTAASFASAPVGSLTEATLATSGSRLSGASRASVLSYRPRSSPPSPTPSAASATTTDPEWPTTSPVGKSFDCTRHVKRSASRSGIAPADPRHRSRPAGPCATLVTRSRPVNPTSWLMRPLAHKWGCRPQGRVPPARVSAASRPELTLEGRDPAALACRRRASFPLMRCRAGCARCKCIDATERLKRHRPRPTGTADAPRPGGTVQYSFVSA